MKHAMILVLLCAAVAGCAGQPTYQPPPEAPQPQSKTTRVNDQVFSQVAACQITKEEAHNIYLTADSECTNEGLKIAVPSPSCTQPPKQDCTGMTGFGLGLCRSYAPPPNCDYSAVEYAKSSQKSVYDNCMTIKGWKKVVVAAGESVVPTCDPAKKSVSAPSQLTKNPESPQEIQQIINTIPELAAWQKNDKIKWEMAQAIDDALQRQPQYQNMPMRDRFLVVVKKVNEASK